MRWNLISLDEVPAVPWRNGGGVTRELLAWPDAASWKVRMSVAEVEQDGPFSRFERVQRWFAVLAGAGVRLRLDGVSHELTSESDPFAFDGGVATDCALLAGATQDFNLMLQGNAGRMARVKGDASLECRAGDLVAVYAHRNGARIRSDGETTQVHPRTLAWRILAAGGPLRVESQDALWMEVGP